MSTQVYEQIIEPTKGWRLLDWRALVQYRDLLLLMVRRDFVSKYKQTVLGPAWFIIQPLLTTVVFTVVFGKVAKIGTEDKPQQLFYLCGLLSWTYFSQSLPGIANSLIINAGLFSKVYFPRLVVPLSLVISNSFAFGLQLLTFMAFFAYFKLATPLADTFHATWWVLAVPLFLLQAGLIALGYGLWLAAMTAKYRDVTHLMSFLVQLWMYATPIIYPLSQIPEKWRLVAAVNPMSSVVELFRLAFLGTSSVTLEFWLVTFIITMLVLLSGLLVFNKVERTFVDVI